MVSASFLSSAVTEEVTCSELLQVSACAEKELLNIEETGFG